MSTTTLLEDLTSLRTIENGLTRNKVANFAYTDVAYENNEVNGVEDYSPARERNIPIADASILKVNPTVLAKGWRSQASSLTRMLMNHFLGRLSYNLNKINDIMSSLLSSMYSHYGTANGFATLDSNGRIPYSQLPESALEYKGDWNAETNTPTLADGTGDTGDMYLVSVAGTQDLGSGEISFLENDRVIYNGSVWQKLSGGSVLTVNGVSPDSATGNVELTKGDIELENVVNSGDSNIPEEDGIKKFTSGGAYDFFAGCTNAKEWLYKALSNLVCRFWAKGTGIGNVTTTIIKQANSIWVCCVNNDGIYWSEDGKSWNKSSNSPSGVSFFTLTYVGNLWLCSISGDGGIYWSEDGKNWTIGTGSTSMTNVLFATFAFGNDKWLAGTYSGAPWTSTDGKTWSKVSDSKFASGCNAPHIDFYNGLFFLKNTDSNNTNTGLFWSEDGESWTKCTGSTGLVNSMVIGYHNSLYFAVDIMSGTSSGYGLWWSEDGKAWTQGTGFNSFGGSLQKIVYANGLYVYGTAGKGMVWSEDGKTWVRAVSDIGVITATVYDIIFAHNVWVCSTDTGIWWSEDGKTWKENYIGEDFHDIVYANGIFLCPSSAYLFRSVDGKEWYVVTSAGQANCLGYADDIWVSGSNGKGIWWSSLDTI